MGPSPRVLVDDAPQEFKCVVRLLKGTLDGIAGAEDLRRGIDLDLIGRG